MLTFVEAHADGRTAIGLPYERAVRGVGSGHPPIAMCCIASIYGANMATLRPLTSDRVAPPFSCESYFACAEIDKWAPPRSDILSRQDGECANAPYRLRVSSC
jgi:hypothetical protein